MANKPIYMVGHSVGPSELTLTARQLCFGRTSALILRETVGRDHNDRRAADRYPESGAGVDAAG